MVIVAPPFTSTLASKNVFIPALNHGLEIKLVPKAMAELANDGRPYTAFKGGLSSNLFHKYSPKGKERMRLVA